ncbi:PREDICTED: uncharacterized protein LOC105313890 [Amphimedon queenslandica]|uniref:CARD domain-containing protein n=1 Tax=Amphimedon queenslandica TaxID=400682 RepID=A0AAN0IP16_AMPQE|nr:PREDICTED: uncharacterized protein LOC105313890 [Amphimedon queenslandica]|eukprot:XP_011405977.2 PREDICTED: uncharacterized protein LOC105313890 [Amphimedon queenslandica]
MAAKNLDYQPVERSGHSTVIVGDYLYMWGGKQTDLPEVHNDENKKAMTSVMEMCYLPTGKWEQRPTNGNPPLGVEGYSSVAIGKFIYYFGGYCGHDDCFHNSLYSFNVDTFNWRELSPSSPDHHGPKMKAYSAMVAVQLNGEDYLAVIGGRGSSSSNRYYSEIHYYELSSGKWVSPRVTRWRLHSIHSFTLTSVTSNMAILFGGRTAYGYNSNLFVISFAKTSVDILEAPNPGGSVQWPEGRYAHCSVLVSCDAGPHLLVIGGVLKNFRNAYDTWLLDINNRNWMKLFADLPFSVTWREYYSLSSWNVTRTTSWMIMFGGETTYNSTAVIELTFASRMHWSSRYIYLDWYEEELAERKREWQIQLDEEVYQIDKDRQYEQLFQDEYDEEIFQQTKELKVILKKENEAQFTQQLQKVTYLLEQLYIAKASLEEQNLQLQNQIKEEQRLMASTLKKQKEREDAHEEQDEIIKSLENKLDEEKKEEKKLRQGLQEKIESLQQQLHQQVKDHKDASVQFDYLIPQSDSLDSSVIIAGQKLFILQGDRSHSLQWEKYGFRLECPQGAASKDTEVAVSALAGGNFKVPKGTVLVSAVYAISVSKGLLKPLVIELQHCVDLRKTSQTGCLKFVRAPLKSPYQFSIVEGGCFRVGKRYGSIKRDQFCCMGIVAEMSNGDTPSDSESEEGYETPPEGSNDDTHNVSVNGAGETSTSQLSLMNSAGLVNDGSNQEVQVESNSGTLNEASIASIKLSEGEVKQRTSNNKGVAQNDVLYTGMMYHEEKKVNQWMTTFSVVRDLKVLQQYLQNTHSNAEQDGPFVIFKYNQPDGILQLCLQDTPSLESGWTVHPDQSPIQIPQYVVDKFIDNPMCSSIHISVYAKPGIAKDPLHCPIELIGIDPSKIIYINRTPPLSHTIDSTSSSSSTASISQTRRETEEGTFRSDIAHRVMTECTGMIKERLDLNTLIDKLLEKRMINERERNKALDERCGLTANQRMDELLSLVKASIREDGEDFGLFLEIIKQENTRRADRLAQTLLDNYNRFIRSV